MTCLQLVADNLTSKEIAAHLGISPHTVDQRVRKALRKLGAQNRRQAARLVQPSAPFESQRQQEHVPTVLKEGAAEFPLPFATSERPTNNMGLGARLGWIAAIAAGSAAASAMYLAGLESLSRLLRP
jgi:hypothetical protein